MKLCAKSWFWALWVFSYGQEFKIARKNKDFASRLSSSLSPFPPLYAFFPPSFLLSCLLFSSLSVIRFYQFPQLGESGDLDDSRAEQRHLPIVQFHHCRQHHRPVPSLVPQIDYFQPFPPLTSPYRFPRGFQASPAVSKPPLRPALSAVGLKGVDLPSTSYAAQGRQ